jgi:RNA polymerase sigma-70 factor (ECF subfamily)
MEASLANRLPRFLAINLSSPGFARAERWTVLSLRCQELPLDELLRQARAGSTQSLGQLLEACRAYLLVVAKHELRAPLQAKVDPADLVQETFIEATRDFPRFRGENEAQLLGWLRGILRHNLTDLSRHFGMSCRCVAQEVHLRDPFAEGIPAGSAQGDDGTICEQLIAQEQHRALEAALQRLPPSYRHVLQLRYDERCSFAEIGNSLHRSPEAARKIWGRALERLRQDMGVYGEA